MISNISTVYKIHCCDRHTKHASAKIKSEVNGTVISGGQALGKFSVIIVYVMTPYYNLNGDITEAIMVLLNEFIL